MPQTMITVKNSETGAALERLGRRWQGSILELSLRPQANGLTVVTITTPSGVDEPADPGPSPIELDRDAATGRADEALARLTVMTSARDASDAEVERLRGVVADLNDALLAARPVAS